MHIRTMGPAYPYAWLDEVVEVTLNPEKTNVTELQYQQLEIIENKFDQQLQVVLNDLKASTFYLLSSKKIKATVTQYYESLMLLEQQAMNNLAGYPANHHLAVTGENLLVYIQNMGIAFKKRYGKYLKEEDATKLSVLAKPSIVSKILCRLSVDQIGIILKAARDSKLILADSMSVIFRSLVPHLSTDKIKNISWESMRKGTYQIEQVDKDVAIATLENLITTIREY